MKAAVTTSDGKMVDLHFGKAKGFYLYEVSGGASSFLKYVESPAYCDWSEKLESANDDEVDAIISELKDCAVSSASGIHNQGMLGRIAETLTGCEVIVTSMIGDAPKEEMERHGFDIFILSGDVETVLSEIFKLY